MMQNGAGGSAAESPIQQGSNGTTSSILTLSLGNGKMAALSSNAYSGTSDTPVSVLANIGTADGPSIVSAPPTSTSALVPMILVHGNTTKTIYVPRYKPNRKPVVISSGVGKQSHQESAPAQRSPLTLKTIHHQAITEPQWQNSTIQSPNVISQTVPMATAGNLLTSLGPTQTIQPPSTSQPQRKNSTVQSPPIVLQTVPNATDGTMSSFPGPTQIVQSLTIQKPPAFTATQLLANQTQIISPTGQLSSNQGAPNVTVVPLSPIQTSTGSSTAQPLVNQAAQASTSVLPPVNPVVIQSVAMGIPSGPSAATSVLSPSQTAQHFQNEVNPIVIEPNTDALASLDDTISSQSTDPDSIESVIAQEAAVPIEPIVIQPISTTDLTVSLAANCAPITVQSVQSQPICTTIAKTHVPVASSLPHINSIGSCITTSGLQKQAPNLTSYIIRSRFPVAGATSAVTPAPSNPVVNAPPRTIIIRTLGVPPNSRVGGYPASYLSPTNGTVGQAAINMSRTSTYTSPYTQPYTGVIPPTSCNVQGGLLLNQLIQEPTVVNGSGFHPPKIPTDTEVKSEPQSESEDETDSGVCDMGFRIECITSLAEAEWNKPNSPQPTQQQDDIRIDSVFSLAPERNTACVDSVDPCEDSTQIVGNHDFIGECYVIKPGASSEKRGSICTDPDETARKAKMDEEIKRLLLSDDEPPNRLIDVQTKPRWTTGEYYEQQTRNDSSVGKATDQVANMTAVSVPTPTGIKRRFKRALEGPVARKSCTQISKYFKWRHNIPRPIKRCSVLTAKLEVDEDSVAQCSVGTDAGCHCGVQWFDLKKDHQGLERHLKDDHPYPRLRPYEDHDISSDSTMSATSAKDCWLSEDEDGGINISGSQVLEVENLTMHKIISDSSLRNVLWRPVIRSDIAASKNHIPECPPKSSSVDPAHTNSNDSNTFHCHSVSRRTVETHYPPFSRSILKKKTVKKPHKWRSSSKRPDWLGDEDSSSTSSQSIEGDRVSAHEHPTHCSTDSVDNDSIAESNSTELGTESFEETKHLQPVDSGRVLCKDEASPEDRDSNTSDSDLTIPEENPTDSHSNAVEIESNALKGESQFIKSHPEGAEECAVELKVLDEESKTISKLVLKREKNSASGWIISRSARSVTGVSDKSDSTENVNHVASNSITSKDNGAISQNDNFCSPIDGPVSIISESNKNTTLRPDSSSASAKKPKNKDPNITKTSTPRDKGEDVIADETPAIPPSLENTSQLTEESTTNKPKSSDKCQGFQNMESDEDYSSTSPVSDWLMHQANSKQRSNALISKTQTMNKIGNNEDAAVEGVSTNKCEKQSSSSHAAQIPDDGSTGPGAGCSCTTSPGRKPGRPLRYDPSIYEVEFLLEEPFKKKRSRSRKRRLSMSEGSDQESEEIIKQKQRKLHVHPLEVAVPDNGNSYIRDRVPVSLDHNVSDSESVDHCTMDSTENDETVVKQPRGRPRKHSLSSSEGSTENDEEVIKWPHGRPRKHSLSSFEGSTENDEEVIKQPRGRPRKHSLSLSEGSTENDEEVLKRPPGRPRKHSLSSSEGSTENDEVIKRPSGRPRKHSLSSSEGSTENDEVIKRPRGRPRKHSLSSSEGSTENDEVIKRPRGRPRKHSLSSSEGSTENDEVIKRPRGRPRKHHFNDSPPGQAIISGNPVKSLEVSSEAEQTEKNDEYGGTNRPLVNLDVSKSVGKADVSIDVLLSAQPSGECSVTNVCPASTDGNKIPAVLNSESNKTESEVSLKMAPPREKETFSSDIAQKVPSSCDSPVVNAHLSSATGDKTCREFTLKTNEANPEMTSPMEQEPFTADRVQQEQLSVDSVVANASLQTLACIDKTPGPLISETNKITSGIAHTMPPYEEEKPDLVENSPQEQFDKRQSVSIQSDSDFRNGPETKETVNCSPTKPLSRIELLRQKLKQQEEALVLVRQQREESKKVIESIDLV